ncbi:hypothetical protein AA098_02685 [Pseudomonas sp. JY-Q]|uniref:hypothetical protein n=1 Tax=Pseudomonas sp. JY-Q TaxID=1338689 RepID=UPI0007DD8D31|nr:hypothetical protein [Pseudomonas sp. JY-Q]ANI32467.1 hypothetical protein AA098_02685 [Pseudomonas sp. JY-Q]
MSKLPEILLPGHPAYIEAVEAMRRYHEAQDAGAPANEVERLRLIAESLFQAVTDYQMKAFGKGGRATH